MSGEVARPNFFLILGLDPEVPWDDAVFASALSNARALWSRQRSGIKQHQTTVDARRNLGSVGEIKRVMMDPGAREAERRAALAERRDDARRQRARLTERVNLMLAKGFLYDAEYEDLQGDLATADEALRQRVEAAQRRPLESAREDDERLDQATERNLKNNLGILGATDLYAVLREVEPGISGDSPRADLSEAADKLYRKARNTADKNRPEVGAMQELAGIARKIFGSDELMRKHTLSMLLLPLTEILERYEQALARVRAIDSRQFELFLEEAAGKGIDIARAKNAFTRYFRERNWSVEPPTASAERSLKAMVACPWCAMLNAPDLKHCANCGNPLKDECPGCGTRISASAGACPQCGFPVGQRPYAEYLAEETEACLTRGDAVGAADFLRQAAQAWPTGPKSQDPVAVRLKRAEEALEVVREQQRQAIEQINLLMESRSYRAARRQLRSLPYSSHATREMLARCEDAVRASDQRLREARRPGLPDERRAVLYLEALDHCADNGEALRELSLLPPVPPRRLRVEEDTERRVVRLTWDPAPDAGCSSVVVRADGPEPPRSPLGQHRHVVVGRGLWEDDSPLIGRPMSYAVFTERNTGGTVSEHAAVTSEPVLLTAEPQVTARPGNREVELVWTLPENAATVEIQREELPGGRLVLLSAPEDGSTRRMDRNVRNEVRYRYTVRAVFTYQVPGRPPVERRSRAAEREVIPMAPPALPGPVFARGGPPPPYMDFYLHRVELSWPQVEQGEVKILRSVPGDQRPTLGQEFAAEELSRYVLVLREPIDIWMRESERTCYYTPVLAYNGRCYVGEARRYAIGPEVSDLRANHVGTSVAVTWDWPDGVGEALVAWDADTEPSDPVAAPLHTRVGRLGTEVAGRYDIAVGPFGTLFVQVAAVVRVHGTEFFTSGARTSLQRRAIVLRYEILPRRGRGQRGRLVLLPDAPVQLPALVLLGRSDDRPADRGDQQIERIPPGRTDPGDLFELRSSKGIQLRSCRLFVEDEGETGIITIVHPR